MFVCVACCVPEEEKFVVKGIGVVIFFAQAVSRVKAGNCLLTMPDKRCFLAFLFWLMTEGNGRNIMRSVLDKAFLFESQNRCSFHREGMS